jgi:acyl carrier protein
VSSLEQRLRSIIAEVAGCESHGFDSDLPLFRGGLELDSLAGAELILRIEREFGISIADEDLDLEALFSLRTLCRFVTRIVAHD